MSLATRCPSCGTVFRVVLDQLRISEGWVRCGRCVSVFDAAEVLFDIDQGTPVLLDLKPPPEPLDLVPSPDTGAGALAPAGPGAAEPPDEPLVITDWSGPADDGGSLPPSAGQAAIGADGPGPTQRIEPGFGQASDWQPGPTNPAEQAVAPQGHLLRTPSLAADDPLPLDEGRQRPAAAAAWVSAPTATNPPAADPAPSFLQAADRAARWRRPAVRTALALGVGLLALTAGLQAALLERDHLAAQWPASAPLLRGLCRVAGCRVEAPRQIDAITVDSSSLGRLDGGSAGQYRLQVVLHNRASVALLPPALELSLTDGQGRLVVRRVLPLAELGLAQPALPPGQAVTLQAVLAAGEQRIDGYTVELFYP